MPDPDARHARIARLERLADWLEQRLERLGRIDARFTWLRVGIFVAGAAGTLLTFLVAGIGWAITAGIASMVAFAGVVWRHRYIERAIEEHRAWLAIRREQLARLTLDWSHLPTSDASAPRGHPFARDLDIVGDRSIGRLIDRTATVEGSRRLFSWLLDEHPDQARLRTRRARVQAMIPDWQLRDRLGLASRLASGSQARWRVAEITDWLTKAPEMSRALVPALIGLGLWAATNGVLFALDRLGYATGIWRMSWLAYFGLVFLLGRLAGDSLGDAMRLERSFRQLRRVLVQLEARARRPADAEGGPLHALLEPMRGVDGLPSRQIRRARWLVAAISVRGNPFAWIAVNGLMPWDLFFAWRLERLRKELNRQVPAWVDLIAEVEALGALADLTHLDPSWRMPGLLVPHDEVEEFAALDPDQTHPRSGLENSDGDGPHVLPGGDGDELPLIALRGAAHPLLPADGRVTNDLTLTHRGEIGLITGSNMSGKSTFLRTVGLAAAMTMAGGPVLAERAVMVPLRPFCSVRIDDSVTDGISFFYAEVRRLSALLEALHDDDPRPLLFLIDEIFRGTNNRERLIGSRAYLRALAAGDGAGLVATHDLELTALADELPHVRNLHFRDDVSDDRMQFDYRLRSGPCPTTNALRIMKVAGLPVQGDPAGQG